MIVFPVRFPWKSNLFSIQYDSLDFGIVTIGNSSSIAVKIYNRRDGSVIINEVYNRDSSFYVNESLPINIAPHDSIEIAIVFEPLEAGTFTDKINFNAADFQTAGSTVSVRTPKESWLKGLNKSYIIITINEEE